MDPAVLYAEAVSALNRNEFPRAFELAAQVVRTAPNHGGVHFIGGVAALQMDRVPQALALLQRACALSPGRADYHAQRARALAAARMFREAIEAADAAIAAQPSDPLTLDTLGVVLTQANDHARASQLFCRAVEAAPDVATFHFNHATALMFAGELDAAEREYEACLALDPGYGRAHLALAQLRTQTPESNHLDRLRGLLPTAVPGEPSMYLHLSIAKEEEDLRRYPQAFEHLVVGKREGARGRAYRCERDERLFAALHRAFETIPRVASPSDSAEPIFVFGMPRSGTTLVDRILSSHPEVHSAGELQNFGALLKRLSGSRTRELIDPDTVDAAGRADLSSLGEAYIASTRPGTGVTPRFVDKLPHNFLYAGFIAAALPNARLVAVRRHPMDVCLSNFRQLFALSSPYYDYSFDPLDTARYYVLFDRLMRHWRALLGERLLEVQYEQLVDAQESTTRALLAHCGLGWNDACLAFEKNEAPVATASVVQVRSPMFRTSLERWKRYGDALAPMRRVLEDSGIPL
ncbi:sulfotransferase family protein [Lysobacter sp. TY2-98]|uniref:tetratricopeptide repeat-containing sulfotransferase family protein n=1 Tax=Lysobacter sp. TY2-98 TaxID=2290922 RepID=UPI000E20A521|nr:sulfotransferase [Lysobacter sp. TY2-98]AXK71947.1 sulfotransferase family protein [Lysobacter sp. TY2-98]